MFSVRLVAYFGLFSASFIAKQTTRWRKPIDTKTRVRAYLLYVCQGMTYFQIGELLCMGKITACKCVHECVYAICRHMFSKYIRFPTIDEANVNMEKFKQKTKLPGIVAAIDGTHIAIKKPCEDGSVYFNRKSEYSINVQGSDSLCASETDGSSSRRL